MAVCSTCERVSVASECWVCGPKWLRNRAKTELRAFWRASVHTPRIRKSFKSNITLALEALAEKRRPKVRHPWMGSAC